MSCSISSSKWIALFDLLDLGAYSLKYLLDCSKREKKLNIGNLGVQKPSAFGQKLIVLKVTRINSSLF